MGSWNDHSSSTGGFYKCNKYIESSKDPGKQKEEQKIVKIKNELQRYMWYYNRWDNHYIAERKAISLKKLSTEIIDYLSVNFKIEMGDLEFLPGAIDDIIECRTVVRWSYAYGYYLSNEQEKALFLVMQEKLEKH